MIFPDGFLYAPLFETGSANSVSKGNLKANHLMMHMSQISGLQAFKLQHTFLWWICSIGPYSNSDINNIRAKIIMLTL